MGRRDLRSGRQSIRHNIERSQWLRHGLSVAVLRVWWALNTLYAFHGSDGDSAYADLIFDASGNLYSTTGFGGPNDAGTAFKLGQSGGVWTYTSLHDFTDNSNGGSDGAEPVASLVFDANGNLYGTTREGGSSGSSVRFSSWSPEMKAGQKALFTTLPAAATEGIARATWLSMLAAISMVWH